jgi:alpha-glucosidase
MQSLTPTSKSSRNSARHHSFGDIKEWQEVESGIEGKSDFAKFRISVYQQGIIRVQASKFDSFESNPYSVISVPEKVEFEVEKNSDLIQLTTSLIKMNLDLNSFALSFFDSKGNILNADDSLGTAWIGSEVTAYKQVQKDEKFIGLGEKTGNLDRFGRAYTNWNTDYFGYGIGDDPLYMSIPFYMGVHEKGAYGIYFDNTHKTVFNFGPRQIASCTSVQRMAIWITTSSISPLSLKSSAPIPG